MKVLCLLLLCMAAAGPVAAAAGDLPAAPVMAQPAATPVTPAPGLTVITPPNVISGTPGPLNRSLPSFVNLTISSIPSGAKIRLNGTDTGIVTPGTVNLSRTRVYAVNLTLTGYHEHTSTVNLSIGMPVNITVQLEPVTVMSISATPYAVPASPGALFTPAVPGTLLPAGSPAAQAKRVPAIRNDPGVVDSFFGFFSGIMNRPDCPPSLRACGKSCVDLTTDPGHCGLCENACPAGAVCSGGECFMYGPA